MFARNMEIPLTGLIPFSGMISFTGMIRGAILIATLLGNLTMINL